MGYRVNSQRATQFRQWATRVLDAFLQFNDAEILQDKGKVTAAIAKAFAESEFEQYRVIQDRLYQSDFDKLMAAAQEDNKRQKCRCSILSWVEHLSFAHRLVYAPTGWWVR